jgi:hypothetical protein
MSIDGEAKEGETKLENVKSPCYFLFFGGRTTKSEGKCEINFQTYYT